VSIDLNATNKEIKPINENKYFILNNLDLLIIGA